MQAGLVEQGPVQGAVGKADTANAPQRKKKRRRAPRIVFPDPDRHRKPAKIHTYVVENYKPTA